MKRTLIFTTITILFLSSITSAQFKIKIPKIKKQKINKSLGSKTGAKLGSTRGKNRQKVMDDGFTFFEASPVKSERIAKYSGYIAKGWTLTSYLRAFGTFPDSSGFKVEVKRGPKTYATYLCEAKTFRKAESPVPEVKNSPDDDYMMTVPQSGFCRTNKKIFVKSPGKYDVAVSIVNGDTDEITPVRTYKIEVKEAKKIRPGGIPGVSDFYIQRHAETPFAILMLRPSAPGLRIKHNYHNINSGSSLRGNVDIYVNAVTARNRWVFSSIPKVRCFVNGKRIKFLNQGKTRIKTMRGDNAQLARDGKRTKWMGFFNYRVNLPIQWGHAQGSNPDVDMKELAGDWRCQLRDGMETVRTFRWRVGSDGFPAEHEEQTSGNINLHWGSYLIDMEIPAGGSSVDHYMKPMPNAGFFYGVPFKTADSKKKASSVPVKGRPFNMQ